MNSSWISHQEVEMMSMLMDESDFMDPFDEELQNYMNIFPLSDSTAIASSSSSSHIHDSAGEPKDHIHNNLDIVTFANYQINPCLDNHVQQVMMNPDPVEDEVVVLQVSKESSEETRVQPRKKKRIRPPSQTYDHIMAERRRREQLSQLFVALSALIPGIKKMDKGSILEDAIKHMKHLQERVKILEEKSQRKAMESFVIVKKSHVVVDEDEDGDGEGSSSDEQTSSVEEHTLPEIEAKVSENFILVKVLCEKQKDALHSLICKVESLNMIVISTNATSFGDVTLDITIVAEMEKEFNLTVKEVVTALRPALQRSS